MNMETTFISFKNKNQNRIVNSQVEITSLAFQHAPGQRGMQGYPRRMMWDDREVDFVDLSMQYLVQKGQELIKLFDLRDDHGATYRLRHAGNQWTLVGIKGGL